MTFMPGINPRPTLKASFLQPVRPKSLLRLDGPTFSRALIQSLRAATLKGRAFSQIWFYF